MAAAKSTKKVEASLPVYAIGGTDHFLRLQALNAVIRLVLGDDRDSMAVSEFDGPSTEPADVFDTCRTAGLLAPRVVVCVRDADLRVRGAESFVQAYRRTIEQYLESPSSTGTLVLLLNNKLAKNTRLYKKIASIGRVIDCDAPRHSGLAAWATRRARDAYGCRMNSAAANRLVDLVGDVLGVVDTELAKLAAFIAPRSEIRLADVEILVGASRLETVFGITDAISRRDVREALTLWEQVLATDRDAPYRSIGGLAWGFHGLAEAKRMVAEGMPVAEAARRNRIWPRGGRFQRQLDRFSLRQWRDHLVQLLRIDVDVKTGLGTVRSSVEKLIVSLCSAP